MSFSYQPTSGVLSGTSFESQSEAFLARAAVGAFPASSGTNLSSSGASTASGFSEKTFTAPSSGWYTMTVNDGAKAVNNTNGMVSNSVTQGDCSVIMPASKGQSITLMWPIGISPTVLKFIPAVEA